MMRLLPLSREGWSALRLPPVSRLSPSGMVAAVAYALRARGVELARLAAAGSAPMPETLRAPIFVVGYWRSGTTLLHGLLADALDRAAPTTHQCFNPTLHWALPQGRRIAARPMDQVVVEAASPQEDEFALVAAGAPSPYALWVAPSRMVEAPSHGLRVQAPEMSSTMATMKQFLGEVQALAARPLVIKSPPHSWRMQAILGAFPDSRFVLIERDPRAVWPSACRMFSEMLDAYALEPWRAEWVQDYVVRTRIDMAETIDRLPAEVLARTTRVSYERLVADPVTTLERTLADLGERWDPARVERAVSAARIVERAPTEALPPAVRTAWSNL